MRGHVQRGRHAAPSGGTLVVSRARRARDLVDARERVVVEARRRRPRRSRRPARASSRPRSRSPPSVATRASHRELEQRVGRARRRAPAGVSAIDQLRSVRKRSAERFVSVSRAPSPEARRRACTCPTAARRRAESTAAGRRRSVCSAGTSSRLDVAHEQAVLVLRRDELARPRCRASTRRRRPASRRSSSSRCSAPCPARTRSSSARSVSSIGVRGSGWCSW